MGLSNNTEKQDANRESHDLSLNGLNRENGDLEEHIEDISFCAPKVSVAVDGNFYESDHAGRKRRGMHLEVSLVFNNLGHLLKRLHLAFRVLLHHD